MLQVRQTVRTFHKSPTNNKILQDYVKAAFGRELQLILDCKTRWSSMWAMMERFVQLKSCVMKATIDLKMSTSFSDADWKASSEIVSALEPLKLAVDTLCRQDANLLTADTALSFAVNSLSSQTTELAEKLLEALCRRIAQRRKGDLLGILSYLHNPADDIEQHCELFDAPSTGRVRKSISTLVSRLAVTKGVDSAVNTGNEVDRGPRVSDDSTSGAVSGSSSPPQTSSSAGSLMTTQSELTKAESLQHQLQQAVMLKMAGGSKPHLPSMREDSSLVTVKKEMELFEEGGSKGTYLQTAYNCLLTIPPSSVESERAFSASGLLCSKIRSSMSDDVLDALVFLRAYFKVLQQESKNSECGPVAEKSL
jgi:hypothetical protein